MLPFGHVLPFTFALSRVEKPVLANKVIAEAVMGLLFDESEPSRFVYASRRDENVVGPQHYLLITGMLGESDALIDEPGAYPHAASPRLDQQQADFGRVRLCTHAPTKDAVVIPVSDAASRLGVPATNFGNASSRPDALGFRSALVRSLVNVLSTNALGKIGTG